MRFKKAQITLFIIVGFVILASIFLLSYIGEEPSEEVLQDTPTEIQPIKIFIESCLKEVAEEGIEFISKQGGYYFFIPDSVHAGIAGFRVPLYLSNDEIKMPPKDTISKELEEYMNDKINTCIDDFNSFQDQGFNVNSESINLGIIWGEDILKLDISYPITITNLDSTYTLNRFNVQLPIRLGRIYTLISMYLAEQVKDTSSVCISCLTKLLEENDLYADFDQIYDDIAVLEIKDTSLGNPFAFIFAINLSYNQEEETPSPVNIDDIPNQDAGVGYLFTYDVSATGSSLKYTDSSHLFNIHEDTGLIEFTPEPDSLGRHLIIVDIEDLKGNTDSEMFILNITTWNTNPTLDHIGSLTAVIGEPFVFKANAADPKNQSIIYTDNSDLFTISSHNGIINFTPTLEQEGFYDITINAINTEGGYDIEEFTLIVIP